MKHRGMRSRLSRIEWKSRRRNKPFIVTLEHWQEFPDDDDGIIYLRMPNPNMRKPTIDEPAKLSDFDG